MWASRTVPSGRLGLDRSTVLPSRGCHLVRATIWNINARVRTIAAQKPTAALVEDQQNIEANGVYISLALVMDP